MWSGSRTVTAAGDAGGRCVTVGLGTNLGDRFDNLLRAIEWLRLEVGPLLAASRVYATDPVGFTDQPEFWNMVACFSSVLPPAELLASAQRIERAMGRTPTFRYGPRIIDIDLLLVENEIIATPPLELPHPRMHDRAFVLQPLAELMPGRIHPVHGVTFAELAASAGTGGVRPLKDVSERLQARLAKGAAR